MLADAKHQMANLAARGAKGQAIPTSRPSGPCTRQCKCRRPNVRVNSTAPQFEQTFFGKDFGARDPTPGEIGSNFGEKVVMNWDTEHIIKPPDAMGAHIGLGARTCQDPATLELLDTALRERLRQQVPGWRVQQNSAGIQCIRQEWTAKHADAAQQLVQRLQEISQQNGHPLTHADAVGSTVIAEVTTPLKGGLTANDFIIADRINSADLSDLLQMRKARFWA
eukprot:GHRR01004154.1.p1 GENE.GHRR01004154.1~~GHRR01004154.1.p1  ORF type:complete len:223 (+),score=70.99 GHRR01004154.1:469-1137(+)